MTNAERWELVQSIVPWIETLLTRMRVDPDERDDMRSYVYIRLAELAHRYDPALGSRTTWSRWQVRGALNEYLRDMRMFGPSSLHRAARLRVPMLGDDAEPCILRRRQAMVGGQEAIATRNAVWLIDDQDENTTIAEIDARHMPGRIAIELARLPAREATAIVQTVAGMRLEDIAPTLGVCRERVRQLKERGLERMREAMGV